MKNPIRLDKWIGLVCLFGLVGNIFNDDPIARVLAWGFLGVIAAMHILFGNKS